jgi:hypothetical protein
LGFVLVLDTSRGDGEFLVLMRSAWWIGKESERGRRESLVEQAGRDVLCVFRGLLQEDDIQI